MQITIKNSH